MKKHPVKFIYFDVGGVLMSWQNGHRKVSEQYNVPLEALQQIFHDNWREACRGTLDPVAYMRKFADLLKLPEPIPELTDFWTDHFTVIRPSHDLVHELKGTYRLGILSNAEHGILAKATKKRLIPDIAWHSFIDSSDHGSIKPEKKIFDIAEAASGVAAEEILFIDDVPEHIHAVVARGWRGVIFDHDNPDMSVDAIRQAIRASEG